MPGLITHYIAGQSALKSIPREIRDYIASMAPLFNLGTQGPDIFYYSIADYVTKRIKALGTQMHDKDLGLFFACIADVLKNHKSPSGRRMVFAYAAGFLTHYAVDVHAHPYVYSQTHDPAAPKLKGAACHYHFETSMDVLMLGHFYNRRPADYQLWQLISPDKLHLRTAAAAVSPAIRQVYNRDINPWDVYRAMEQMAFLSKCLQSKRGIRKRLLQGIEGITVGSRIFSALIHMQDVTDGRDYLNMKNAAWSPPWAQRESSTNSFLELFEAAVENAVHMIQAMYAYMNNEISQNQLTEQIKNYSLKTGHYTIAPGPGRKNTGMDAPDICAGNPAPACAARVLDGVDTQ